MGKIRCMEKLEHIGIAVSDLNRSNRIYTTLLGAPPYKTEEVPSEQVLTSFFRVGEVKIELLESTDPEGVIARFIRKRGEGLHHIAFAVQDIRKEMERLQAAGFTLLQSEPKRGADNKWVCFLHPRDFNGVLIELCQDIE